LQDCFLGYPEEFRRAPLGYSIYQNFRTQVANADAASMVLFQNDFVDGCPGLNARGQEKLARIAHELPRNFFPVVIEELPCAPDLAAARRAAVLAELCHGPFPIPPERVVIGGQIARGLDGREAFIIYTNQLAQTRRLGASGGGGGGSSGGGSTVGQGFSPSVPSAGSGGGSSLGGP
jgi:uncharacterized membrane protein YgcG